MLELVLGVVSTKSRNKKKYDNKPAMAVVIFSPLSAGVMKVAVCKRKINEYLKFIQVKKKLPAETRNTETKN